MKKDFILPKTDISHKDLFLFIQQAATIGSWEYDIENNNLTWSEVTKDIHEVEADFVPNLENAIEFYADKECKETITNAVNDAIIENKNWDLELRITTRKGNKKWVRAIGYPVHSGDTCVKLYGLFQDITPAKSLEVNIKSLLKITTNQNKRLLNFAHIVSHNLRSHSSNFNLLLNLMKDEYPEIENNEFYPMLTKASAKLNETIHNLNEVAQTDIHLKENFVEINVYEEINKIIESLSGKIKSSNTKIVNKVDRNINIKTIPAYFESIFLNLISNSIKYKKDSKDPEILISSLLKDEFFIVKFKDKGKGIDLKLNKHKIFGMYNTFHENKDSRGLGLFLIKNEIEAMQGKITVKSKLDLGTTFYLHFKL